MIKYKINWRLNLVFIVDLFVITVCYFTAYIIRFEGFPPEKYSIMLIKTLPLVLVIRILSLRYFGAHKGIWQYASIKDLTNIIIAISISSLFIVALMMSLYIGFPRSVFIIDWLLLVILLSGTRVIVRLTRPFKQLSKKNPGKRKRILIFGAGDAAETVLREMVYRYNHTYEVVGLLDDDPRKLGKSMHGVTVLDNRTAITEIAGKKNVEEILIAIPSISGDNMRAIVGECIKSGVRYRTLPGIGDIVNGKVGLQKIRDVRLEDLLNREVIKLHKDKISGYLSGKRILITGAGGSIGSELCAEAAKYNPQELILLDQSENALFNIDRKLTDQFPDVERIPLIGDICDRQRVEEIFVKYGPHIIFHTAAYKQVPLSEGNLREVIKNNIMGTKIIANASIKFKTATFVMISTDKAVNPSSLMGVSKRIGEMYLAELSKTTQTKFISVRFGNVLGSQGSVIPTFQNQIKRGGPITLTHPRMERFFITIPEAAGLAIEAGAMGTGGEIFILEMGVQVKILDLARDLIQLSGLRPDKDIKIIFTGLRPGEKMSESLASESEKLEPTEHEKISVIKPINLNSTIIDDVAELEELMLGDDINILLSKLIKIVPSYQKELTVSPGLPVS